MNRESWDSWFLRLTRLAAERTTCAAGRQVGTVLVKDKRILAMGFNGVSVGYPHPTRCARREAGCQTGENLHICPCIHAEANALMSAARAGVAIKGATCYATTQPCTGCMGLLANAGITEVVFDDDYNSPETERIAEYAGVKLVKFAAPEKRK